MFVVDQFTRRMRGWCFVGEINELSSFSKKKEKCESCQFSLGTALKEKSANSE